MDVDGSGHPEPRGDTAAAAAVSPSLSRYSGPQRLNRVACKECRQAKSRCDVKIGNSAPCSRCRRLMRECHVESIYKRVKRRVKLDELAQQVQQLQSVVRPGGAASNAVDIPSGKTADGEALRLPQAAESDLFLPSASISSNDLTRHHSGDLIGSTQGENFAEIQQRAGSTSALTPDYQAQASTSPASQPQPRRLEAPANRARSIESVNLSSEQVDDLFRRYFDHYHPFLSVLDPISSPDEYFTRSPLLFWTVISVASRRYEDDPTLLLMLSQPVTALVWRSLSILPHTRFLVQAIVILCMWPFPTSTMWADPSFLLVSVAKSAALQIGLHRPENIQDFSRTKYRPSPDEIREFTKIWSACYIASQLVTSALGHEPLFRSDRTVDRACELDNEGILPDDFRCQLIITKFSALASTVMSENAQNDLVSSREERNSTITRLEYNLDALEVQLEGKNRVLNQIWLSCARLQLHVFYFFETSVCDIRKRGLLKAFETASSVVEQMTAADAKSQLMAYAPNYLYRMLILAAICLLKILSSNYSPYVDCASGKRLFNSSLILLRRCSLENNDSVGRASKILGQLWSVHRTLAVGDEEPSLRVRTRLSASVLHDALWFWRQEFGGQENAYRAAEENEATPLERNAPLAIAGEKTIPDTRGTDGNVNASPNFMAGLDMDTEWMFDLGLASFTPHDVDYSSNIQLPFSNFQQRL